MSLQDTAEGYDFYPTEMGASTLLPFPNMLSAHHSSPSPLSFSSISSFHPLLGSRSPFPPHLLILPLPPSISHQLPPPPHTHTHALYSGRLHRLISPHCDTFGAAACGLLIISTADSRHAPLSPTMQPLMHTGTRAYMH